MRENVSGPGGSPEEPGAQGRPAPRGKDPDFGASGYRTAPDGTELFYRFWEPETTRAVLLALHGMCAHGEWYESLSIALLPRGIAVCAPDLRGHGLTRFDLGRIPGPELMAED